MKLISFRSIVLCLAISMGCCIPSQAALVGHWTADGNAIDQTGNGHDGTLFGQTAFTAGRLGDAFSFDGQDDFVAIPNAFALEPSVMTVAAFVRMPNTSGVQRLIVDSSHGFVDNAGWALQTNTNGSIGFTFGNGSTFTVASSNVRVDDDQFHHIAGVLDGSTISIFVDGLFESSLPYSGSPMASGRELRIGASWGGSVGGSVREVNGLIDDVRLYDEALTATQISSLATAIPEPNSLTAMGVTGVCILYRRRKLAQA